MRVGSRRAHGARSDEWAVPVMVDGVANLHRITPTLYRSAQPSAHGMRGLERLGIRRVINLRRFSSDVSHVRGTMLTLDEMRIKTWHVRDHHVIAVLRLVQQRRLGPFLIHCWHGADRTGLMSAMYRIVVQGWAREDALAEMMHGGYGFHRAWQNIVAYVEGVDLEVIRAGLASPRRASPNPRLVRP